MVIYVIKHIKGKNYFYTISLIPFPYCLRAGQGWVKNIKGRRRFRG